MPPISMNGHDFPHVLRSDARSTNNPWSSMRWTLRACWRWHRRCRGEMLGPIEDFSPFLWENRTDIDWKIEHRKMNMGRFCFFKFWENQKMEHKTDNDLLIRGINKTSDYNVLIAKIIQIIFSWSFFFPGKFPMIQKWYLNILGFAIWRGFSQEIYAGTGESTW